jgi:hypothetical protein|tara:strand:- start:215 stop:556 length:342 start_codon:yes stop_codon:yes gene_type:complete
MAHYETAIEELRVDEQKKKFGGAWWDTLFILIKDNDKDFIFSFVDRMACHNCRKCFFDKIKDKNLDLNKPRKEVYRTLWNLRCLIDSNKYWDKNTDEDLYNYLKYLCIEYESC